MFVSSTVRRWRAPTVEESLVTVSLAIVRHSIAATGPNAFLIVRLLGTEAGVVVQVRDTHDQPARVADGLQLVETIACSWGSYRGARVRVTWAEVLLNPKRPKVAVRRPVPLPGRLRRA